MQKHVFGQMRTTKAQNSLYIGMGWSGPSLSANRIIVYYRMYEWKANSRAQLFKTNDVIS